MTWGPYSQWSIVESWSLCPEDYGWCQRTAGSNSNNYYEYKKEYEKLKTTFNPTQFDPDKWAKAAKNAGMKYVVAMSKHHDGFCMYDTKTTDYRITDKECPFHSNPKSNILKEILQSFSNEGFMSGIYFSKPDWKSEYYWDPYFPPLDRNVNYDPEQYPEKWNKFVEFTHNQIMELMTDYGNIDILWLDGGWVAEQRKEIKEWYQKIISSNGSGFIKGKMVNQDIKMDELVKKVREKQPGLIVVDRAVKGKNQNYLTPENTIPNESLPYPWESCIISGGGWSWVKDAKYKSSLELVHMLIDIVCKGGNLLLNIAPDANGNWDEDAYVRLEDIGVWMDINSEAIYKTRAIAPFKEANICFTKKRNTNTIYAIYMIEDINNMLPQEILIKSFVAKAGSEIKLLGYDKNISWKEADNGIIITVPKEVQDNPPSKYASTFKIDSICNENK